MCRLSPRERRTSSPGRASEPTTSTRRTPVGWAATFMEGHQPPTTRQVGALTSRVTSLPAVTTAIGVLSQVPRLPAVATAPLSGVRACSGSPRCARSPAPPHRGTATSSRPAGPAAARGRSRRCSSGRVSAREGVVCETAGLGLLPEQAAATRGAASRPVSSGRRGSLGRFTRPGYVPEHEKSDRTRRAEANCTDRYAAWSPTRHTCRSVRGGLSRCCCRPRSR